MPELTPLEAAETLETAYGWQKNKGIPCVDAALFAASILRRVESGELREVVHCKDCNQWHDNWCDTYSEDTGPYFFCANGALMDGKDDSNE